MSHSVTIGSVTIGGGAPCAIQSMLNVPTEDVGACLTQIERLRQAGCEIVRLAVPTEEAATAFAEIRRQTDMPLVADIHFDYKLALLAIEAGADKIRINPGNIGGPEKVRQVVHACKERGIPIRVGVNSGSLEKDLLEKHGGPTAEALAESALKNCRLIEDMGYSNLVISIKSSDVATMGEAYRIVADKTNHPLHIGVTEAGAGEAGIIKSAVGIGSLLLSGIGDTLRVSLTGDPVREIDVAQKILAACGLRKQPLNLVACPTCGRTKVDLPAILEQVEGALTPLCRQRAKEGKAPLTVAVMGCAVNGPGEAREADIGVACGDGKGLLFAKGEILHSVPEEAIPMALAELAANLE